MLSAYLQPTVAYEGIGIGETRKEALVKVVHRARRFFPPGSAAEIWEEFRPAVLRTEQACECHEALGWLAMLLPTHEAAKLEGDWGAWAKEWVEIWQSTAHCRFWDCLWLSLFARLGKHDIRGVVDWPMLLPTLALHWGWVFEVPVGAATASPPFYYESAPQAEALFSSEVHSRSSSIAKTLIYLLGRNGTTTVQDDPALTVLKDMAALLEQYFHPSNGGRWTATLSNFLREASDYFCSRLISEHYTATNAKFGSDTEGADDDVMSDEDEAEGIHDGGAIGSEEEEEEEEEEDGGSDSSDEEEELKDVGDRPTARRPMGHALRREVTRVLVQLASTAQFAKDRGLQRSASAVFASLSNVAPDLVLPLIHKHFITALETVTASHNLSSAIQTMSLCVRPLLIAGLTEDEGAIGSLEAREAGAAAVASAMMAALPGIDANDPPKSLAAFRFYCCVLSSIGELPSSDSTALDGSNAIIIPLDTEQWSMELFERIFAIISNLDVGADISHNTSGMDGDEAEGSFLLDGKSMFRPLVELLFARLPPSLKGVAIKRTARFLLENTLTSMSSEASLLCNAIAWNDPEAAAETLMKPLLEQLQNQVAETSPKGPSPSKVQENQISWRLGLISSLTFHMGPKLLLFQAPLLSMLRSLSVLPSQGVQSAVDHTLSSILMGLTSYYPLQQYSPVSKDVIQGVEDFADKFGNVGGGGGGGGSSGCQYAVQWHVPTPEEGAFAAELMHVFLVQPSKDLIGMKYASREELRIPLFQIASALNGLRSSLADFSCTTHHHQHHHGGGDEEEKGVSSSIPATLVGRGGSVVSNDPSIREMAAAALLDVMQRSRDLLLSDVDGALKWYLRAVENLIMFGSQEYISSMSNHSAWATDERWMHEPAVSGLLYQQVLGQSAMRRRKWRRRRPIWLVMEKVSLTCEWRASQAAYRHFARISTTDGSLLTIDQVAEISPLYRAIVARVVIPLVFHVVDDVRERAGELLTSSVKRFPALTRGTSRYLFCGLVKINVTEELSASRVTDDALLVEGPEVLLPRLRDIIASVHSTSADKKKGFMDQQESEEDQAMASGVCRMFINSRPYYRLLSRDWEAMHALMLCMLGSAVHTSPDSWASILTCLLWMFFKLIKNPLPDNGVATAICSDLLTMQEQHTGMHWRFTLMLHSLLVPLLPWLSPDKAGQLAKHFYSLVVATQDKIDVLTHQIAMAALNAMLLHTYSHHRRVKARLSSDVEEAIEKELRSAIEANPQWKMLFKNLSRGHSSLASTSSLQSPGRNQSRSLYSMQKESVLSKTVVATVKRCVEWSSNRPPTAATKRDAFSETQARTVAILASLAPRSAVEGLREPVLDALALSQDTDPPATSASAEVLAGLLASGVGFNSSAWNGWVRNALRAAICASPLENIDLWAVTVLPFVVNNLVTRSDLLEFLPALIQEVMMVTSSGTDAAPPTGDGDNTTLVYKRLLSLLVVGVEATTVAGIHSPPSQVWDLLVTLHKEMRDLVGLLGSQASSSPLTTELVRTMAAKLACFTVAVTERSTNTLPGSATNNTINNTHSNNGGGGISEDDIVMVHGTEAVPLPGDEDVLMVVGSSSDAGGTGNGHTLSSQTRTFMESFIADFNGSVGLLTEALKDNAVDNAAASSSLDASPRDREPEGEEEDVPMMAVLTEEEIRCMQTTVQGQGAPLMPDNDVGVPSSHLSAGGGVVGVVAGAGAGQPVMSSGAAMSMSTPQTASALRKVAFAAEFVTAALEGDVGPQVSSYLMAMLPGLFKLQELIPSELQSTALAVRKALAELKYLPLWGADVQTALHAVSNAVKNGPLWPERASALVYLQYFWFRHIFVLSPKSNSVLTEIVLHALGDSKLEVRELAAATLSGMVKGFSESENEGLRLQFLSLAQEVFPLKGKRRRIVEGGVGGLKKPPPPPTSPASSSTLERRHGAVLGLRAFVLSSPYDVPPWLPDVLMGLVRLASEPPPVRTTVTKTLAEFRRTHQGAGLAEAKDAMSEEQWEAIRDVAGYATYFV